MTQKTLKIEEMIEKYRYWIGGGLLFLILVGSGMLIWRENYGGMGVNDRISALESRISQLEDDNNQDTGNNNQTNSNDQISNDQNGAQEQGQVAGETTTSQEQVTSNKQQVTGKININTATATQLDTLPGIGSAYAGRIIEYRNSSGGFKTIEEIKNIKGIGEKTYEKLKNLITVN